MPRDGAFHVESSSPARPAIVVDNEAAEGKLTTANDSGSSSGFRLWLELARSDGIPRRSLKVALVVGTILNLINQGTTIFSWKEPVYWKMALTYVVPFMVATYGAVSAKLAHKKASAAVIDACGAQDGEVQKENTASTDIL